MLDQLAMAEGLAGDLDDTIIVARHPGRRPDQGRAEPTGPGNRRREPRLHAIEDRIWIQWWQDEILLGRCARLINVSRNGAMIVAWALLREAQTLRIFLEEPAPQDGVEARVLGVMEAFKGMHQIRLQFPSPCPDDFFEAAVYGFQSWLARGKGSS